MPTKDERQRRRQLVREQTRREQAHEEARLPLPKAQIKELFDFVNTGLEIDGCDHTLRHTLAWLAERHVARDPVVAWLGEYGGYCDCEVIANVEERWGPVVGSVEA